MDTPEYIRTVVLTHRRQNNALVAAECESLTGVLPGEQGLAINAETARVTSAAYLSLGLTIIASECDFAALCAATTKAVAQTNLDGFKLSLINRSSAHINQAEHIIPLADAIPWYPDLSRPIHDLVLLVTDHQWMLGRVVSRNAYDYRCHDQKPLRTSYSMPAQLARAMVNLLPAGTGTVLDPCCGSGSLPIEAAAVGLTVSCGDLNPKMVTMTNTNLQHFGFDAPVACLDARAWQGNFDAVVTDLPYGIYNHTRQEDRSAITGILENLSTITRVAVVVALNDLSEDLQSAGFESVEVFEVAKHTGLVRYIHRATSS